MLQDTEGALHDAVLEDGSGRNVDCAAFRRDDDDGALQCDATAQVDLTRDGEMVELEDLRDGRNVLLEVGDLLEVRAELDERRRAEAGAVDDELAVLEGVEIRLDEHEIGAGLDGQEAATGNVDTVGVLEVANGGTDRGLELDDRDVGLALLIGGDRLVVGDDLHLELVVLNNTLDRAEVHPDVVGVEVLELLDRLELVDVLLGDLGDFEETDVTLVVDDGTTLDVGLGLVGQLHDVLSLGLNHVLENAEIDNGSQVVGVGQEDDLHTTFQELVEDAGVVERLEHVTVSRRVPVGDLGVVVLGSGEERVLEDTGVAGLVEGHDIDVVALVLLDDGLGVGVGVERVHQDERHVNVVGAVEVLDLADGEIQEGHAVTDLNDGLGTDAAHGGTETTIKLDDGQLVEELDGLGVGELVVVDDLARVGRSDAVPRDGVALGLVVQVSPEESEEVVHLGLEALLLVTILDGVGESVEGIAHLASGDVRRGILESLIRIHG